MIKNEMRLNKYKVWEVIDMEFEASYSGNPFTEVEFYAVVTGENYEKKIHGFYNGEHKFIVRMCFDEAGLYDYKTFSNVAELESNSGSIEIEGNHLGKKGPVVLNDKNPNRLFYQDGSHYNLNAIECDWLFAMSYDDKEAMTKTKRMVDVMSENAFNHVVMNVYAYDLQWEKEEWERDPRISPEHDFSAREDIFPFLGSNTEPDYSMLNTQFFNHLDKVIGLLDAFGRLLTVHDYGFCHKYPELVDIISYQTWVLQVYSKMKETLEAHPDKVIFNIEHGGYEEGPYQIFTGNYTNPKVCLRRNYEVMFAGSYGCYYWQPMSWSILMLPEEAKEQPHLEYYKYMKEFWDNHRYEEMNYTEGIGHGGLPMATDDMSLILMYVPKENYAVTIGGHEQVKGKIGTYHLLKKTAY